MTGTGLKNAANLIKGTVAAILLTLILMLLLAVAAVYLKISDVTLTWSNQFVKFTAIVFGTGVSVGRGGENGFITGMALAIIYMALGYAMYVFLGGNAFNAAGMLGEILVGAAIGSVAGAVFANLPPRRRRKAR